MPAVSCQKWNWLQLSKHSLNLYGFRHTGSSREKTDADLLRELEVLLQPQVATAQRCKTLKELCESDKINRLADVSGLFIFFLFNRRILFETAD